MRVRCALMSAVAREGHGLNLDAADLGVAVPRLRGVHEGHARRQYG